MPPESLQRQEKNGPPSRMDQDEEEENEYYERLAGRAGNWELSQKPRPFHNVGRLLLGVVYNLICWVAIGGLLWCAYKYQQTEERRWMEYALISLVTFIIFQIARYTNGLATLCPLCHGTPLHEKGCRKHQRANKFGFLNHRASTVFSIITRGRFNCMYCGTPFRLRGR